jgi:hypothetical protein
MFGPFSRKPDVGDHDKNDRGAGSLDQYAFDLIPSNRHVTMTLAGSNPFQVELERVRSTAGSELEAFIARRTIEQERTDAPVEVRFFVSGRMSGLVGFVPRGLEAAVFEGLSRIEDKGSGRITATIVSTRHGLRVKLLMGTTR